MSDKARTTEATASEREAAAHVLWAFEREGYQPGSFIENLLEAWARADLGNQFRLGLGFPEYREAIRIYRDEGVIALKKWAGLLPSTTDEGTE